MKRDHKLVSQKVSESKKAAVDTSSQIIVDAPISAHLAEDKGDLDKINDITQLWITIIDVGQGESTLIRYRKRINTVWNDEHVVIVDGGRAHFAAETIVPTLIELGVKKIDTVVCSHYDADHMEGLTELAKHDPFKMFERSSAARSDDDKVNKFRSVYKNRAHITKGQKILLGKDEKEPFIKCLCVDNEGSLWSAENDYSIGLLLTFGEFKFYLGGDLTSIEEDKLALDHVCAFKCGHHGSKHSTSVSFLGKVQSSAAFISAANHSYCHPDDDTLKRLCSDTFVKKIYLTNCVYNRAGVNPDFEAKELELRDEICLKIKLWLENNGKLIKNKPPGFDEILALKKSEVEKVDIEAVRKMIAETKLEIKGGAIQGHLSGDHNKAARKSWNELACFYFAARDIHTQFEDRKTRNKKGIVAANANHLGNIHLIVNGADALANHKFGVYFSDGTGMKMIAHDCGKETEPVVPSGREYVKIVERKKTYEFTKSFSLWTGPSGEERKLLTPNEFIQLGDMVSDLCDLIVDKKGKDDKFCLAVRNLINGVPRTGNESKELNDFMADYDEAVELYNTLLQRIDREYDPMNPAKRIIQTIQRGF